MFKRSKIKIVAAITAIMALLMFGTLCVIYISSYGEMSRENKEMLKAHAQAYAPPSGELALPPSTPELDSPRPDERPPFDSSPHFKLSTFYTVALTADGKTLDIQNDQPTLYTNEYLEALAKQISDGSRDYGKKGNLSFYSEDRGVFKVIVFMDNTLINDSSMTLFRYTLIFGGVAMLILFLLSVFLADRIVKPLEKSYKKQKQFVSDAGHELKTPLSVITLNAELLQRELGENAWLANIRHESERMNILVADLLDLAKAEAVKPHRERVDLSRLVLSEALPFESVAFENSMSLSLDISENIFINADPEQLRQVVSVLTDNAVRHGTEGDIHISLSREHRSAVLRVVNHGNEIPREERELLFERFYRIDRARNGSDRHYGLGLSIAKAITDSHGGSIELLCHNGLVEFKLIFPLA